MEMFGRYCGWRRLWLVCLGLCVWIVVQAILTILPSRADVADAYVRRAIAIEKRFDFSLRNMDSSRLASRYAGFPGDDAVTIIRDKLHRAYLDSLTRARPVALHTRNMESIPEPKGSGALLWLDDQRQLTPEVMAKLNSELDQLTQHYQDRLAALPAQTRKAVAFGVLLVCVPMALLYLFGALLAPVVGPPRADVNPTPTELPPVVCGIVADAIPKPAPADRRGARDFRFPPATRWDPSFSVNEEKAVHA